jgi:hypothetical protein
VKDVSARGFLPSATKGSFLKKRPLGTPKNFGKNLLAEFLTALF